MRELSIILKLPVVYFLGGAPDDVAAKAIAAAEGLNHPVLASLDGGFVIVYPTMTHVAVTMALSIARCTQIGRDCIIGFDTKPPHTPTTAGGQE